MFRTPISFEAKELHRFEGSFVIRDKDGNPVARKTITTDSPAQLSQFFMRTRGKPKKKKHKKVAAATSEKDIKQALDDINTYVETEYKKDNEGDN